MPAIPSIASDGVRASKQPSSIEGQQTINSKEVATEISRGEVADNASHKPKILKNGSKKADAPSAEPLVNPGRMGSGVSAPSTDSLMQQAVISPSYAADINGPKVKPVLTLLADQAVNCPRCSTAHVVG